MGAAVGDGTSRRPRLALAAVPVEPTAGAVPVAAIGLVLLLAGTSSMMVPFFPSGLTANMAPLLSTALETWEDDEEPVD